MVRPIHMLVRRKDRKEERGPAAKTTLIKSLVKHYTNYSMRNVKGPVTVVACGGLRGRLCFRSTSGGEFLAA